MRCRFICLVMVAAGVGAPMRAHAYVRTRSPDGQYPLIWREPRIAMTVHMGVDLPVSLNELLEATTRALATWNAPENESSIALSMASSAEPAAGPSFDHQSTISFRTSDWDPPRYGSQVLALTTIWSQRGAIVDADVEINGVAPAAPWALLPDDPAQAARLANVDLQATLTHELGHVVGLAHPCYLGAVPAPTPLDNLGMPIVACATAGTPRVLAATMFPSAAPGEIRERQLSDDERQALLDLYPKGQDPVVEGDDASAGGCAVATGAAGVPFAGGLAASVLLLRLRPRRTRAHAGT